LLEVSLNKFFKLKTIKKIIEIRFLNEYSLRPIFVEEEFWMRSNDFKVEISSGETIKRYLLDKRTVMVKIGYENGVIVVNMKNYQTIGKLKRKLYKKFCLGADIIFADEEKKSH
jgi:hypothetical protein